MRETVGEVSRKRRFVEKVLGKRKSIEEVLGKRRSVGDVLRKIVEEVKGLREERNRELVEEGKRAVYISKRDVFCAKRDAYDGYILGQSLGGVYSFSEGREGRISNQ